MNPPLVIGGSRVVAYAVLKNVRPTGATVHAKPDGVIAAPYGIAVCGCPDEGGWFLFRCDKEWNVLADTWHSSEAEAKSQAEFEYEGVTAVWRQRS